jgi:hypothetical protein
MRGERVSTIISIPTQTPSQVVLVTDKTTAKTNNALKVSFHKIKRQNLIWGMNPTA